MKNLPAFPHLVLCSYLLSGFKPCKIIYYWIPGEESRGDAGRGRARHRGRPRSACFARGAVDQYHLVNNFFITTTITRSNIILELKHFFSLDLSACKYPFKYWTVCQLKCKAPSHKSQLMLCHSNVCYSNIFIWLNELCSSSILSFVLILYFTYWLVLCLHNYWLRAWLANVWWYFNTSVEVAALEETSLVILVALAGCSEPAESLQMEPKSKMYKRKGLENWWVLLFSYTHI